jgi:hypothetical protein
MEPYEAAPIMTAMRDAFPILRGNTKWARDIETMCAGMSDEELEVVRERAAEIAERIAEELIEAFGYVP